jgi:hypothetical protein
LITPLTGTAKRLWKIREQLLAIGDLVGRDTLVRMHRVTLEEMDVLARLEVEIGEMEKEQGKGADA